MAGITAEAGERRQAVALTDHDDLGELAITRAAGPARHLEDVLHDVVGDGIAFELAHGP